MLKQRRQLGDQVAETLFAAEAAIDAALTKTAGLAAVMPNGRIDARLSAVVGQDAVDRISETLAALFQARRGIVETHKELAVVQKQIGLGAVAYGGGITKPQVHTAEAGPNLRPVKSESTAA